MNQALAFILSNSRVGEVSLVKGIFECEKRLTFDSAMGLVLTDLHTDP